MKVDPERQIARIPRLIVILGVVGTGVAGLFGGFGYAGAFFIGAGAAYFNFKLVERVVTGLTQRVAESAKAGSGASGESPENVRDPDGYPVRTVRFGDVCYTSTYRI